MKPVVGSIHELFFEVEVLGSQPDLHLDESLGARSGLWEGYSKISQLKSVIKAFVGVVVWGRALSYRKTKPLVSIPRRLFWIDLWRLISVSQKNLWRYCGLRCHEFCQKKFPYNFLKEFISHNWVSSSTTFVMHIIAPIPEFSAPFSHTSVTHNIITVYTTQSTMNLDCALFFCVKKTNSSTYLTAGGSGDDSVHVSSAITPTLRSENAWR
jgi:hypothetical protein